MTKRRKKKKMRNGIGVVEGSDAGNAEDDVGETTARKRKMRTKSEDVEGGGENVGVGRKKKMMTKRRKKKKRRTGIGVVEEDIVDGRRKRMMRKTTNEGSDAGSVDVDVGERRKMKKKKRRRSLDRVGVGEVGAVTMTKRRKKKSVLAREEEGVEGKKKMMMMTSLQKLPFSGSFSLHAPLLFH